MVRIVNSHRLHPYPPFMMYLVHTKKKKMWQYALLLSSLSTTICSAYSCSTPVNPIDCFWPPKVYSSICLLHMSFIADICYLVLSTYLSKITVYHKGYHLLFMNWMHAMSWKKHGLFWSLWNILVKSYDINTFLGDIIELSSIIQR